MYHVNFRELSLTLWKLLRPQTYILLAVHVLIAFCLTAYAIGGSTFTQAVEAHRLELLAGLLLMALWYMFSAGVNDVSDVEIDKINLAKSQDRPLISGDADRRGLTRLLIVLAVVILALSTVLSVRGMVVSAVMLVLSCAYSLPPARLSYRGLVAQLLLPIGYVAYPFYLGFLAVGGVGLTSQHILLAIALYAGFVSRVLLKDFRDVIGDAKYGKHTFLLRHGVRTTTYLSLAFHLLATVGLAIVLLRLGGVQPAAGLVGLLALPAISLFVWLARQKTWRTQQIALPYLSRIKSLQSIVVLFALLFLTGEFNGQVFYMSLVVIGYAFAVTVGRFVYGSDKVLK